jgi:DNA-binding transcriptional regulator PaaX
MTMVDAWHRWFTSDPHLPVRHLPADWGGPDARAVAIGQGQCWTERATRFWHQLER